MLEPQFVERVWGARTASDEVRSLYPEARIQPQRVGEVWLTGNENRIAKGPWAGKTLRQLISECGTTLLGSAPEHPSGQPVFPLLVKFLFTTDKLSVQVHPPDDAARPQNSWGKTEMWHILGAAASARLAIGFRDDIPRKILKDAERLRDAARTGAIEEMLDWQTVKAGETYFVPAGTVHAIGGGITLCEIQQNSDITYRLYDYNRPGTDGQPRALHVSKATEVIDPRSDGGRTEPVPISDETGARQLLSACPYFATERWELRQTAKLAASGHLEIWIALQGTAEFAAGGSSETIQAGEVVIMPAAAGSFTLRPHESSLLLRTYPPDWERDIVAALRAAGKNPEQLTRTCFPNSNAKPGNAA